LAVALIERLQHEPEIRVLDFASGSGRNGEALRRAGFTVVSIDDRAAASDDPVNGAAGSFDAVVSTHGLLHGSVESIAMRVRVVAGSLERGGLLYATFGSTRDARFGRGERLGDATFAPLDGDERGVAHTYFDREGLSALLAPYFQVESLHERDADETAGKWAHREEPLRFAVHWFATARKR
jgi:hypothetical protein